jgi:NAD(P)-dependent dehydrogenase (short-subunit alcohol dehydrogenase family)
MGGCIACCKLLIIPIGVTISMLTYVYLTSIVNPIKVTPVALLDKICVITGGTTGIGMENVKIMAPWGAHIVLPVRNATKAETLKKAILSQFPHAQITIFPGVDFKDLGTVKRFASEFKSKFGKLDILIHNAAQAEIFGGSPTPKDGIESTFQVNHLAPYLLTKLLLPSLHKALSSSDDVRVVSGFPFFFFVALITPTGFRVEF